MSGFPKAGRPTEGKEEATEGITAWSTCDHRAMVIVTDAVARPTVRGTRPYTHTRTLLMRVRAATEVPRGLREPVPVATHEGVG
jgi:hypothetical protein